MPHDLGGRCHSDRQVQGVKAKFLQVEVEARIHTQGSLVPDAFSP